jgi:hypothetical protein
LVSIVGAEPPRIVKVIPDHGDIQVDPSLAALNVEFDQDMDMTSFSWVGGGESFPELNGQPSWFSPRVCLLPVTMKPGRLYQFSINGGRFTGFHNRQGEPVAPHPVMFTTARDPADDTPTLDEATNRASIDTLRAAIENHYSYRDRLGLDWDALFKQHDADLLRASSAAEFALVGSVLLAAAEDLHMSIGVGDVQLSPHPFTGQRNYNFGAVNQHLEDLTVPNDLVQHGRVGDNIGYVRINSWNGNQAEALKAAVDAYKVHAHRRGLIVDVRGNGGGAESLARPLAGCFISEPKVYSWHRFRDAERPSGFTPFRDRIVPPNRAVDTYAGRVVVLIGPVVCSSNESFVEMMKQAPRCTLIGMATYGSSGNPRSHELPNGVTVRLPSWQDFLADRSLLEGVGIPPDVEVKTVPADFANADPVFARAVEFLRDNVND